MDPEVITGPLVPLLAPLIISPRHSIPARSNDSLNLPKEWKVETFVIPAAFPRAFAFQAQKERSTPRPIRTSEEIYEKQTEAQSEQLELDDWEGQTQLFMVGNRYYKESTSNVVGKTLLFAHANGFHKEIFEPTIFEMVGLDSSISEIFSLDCINSGQSTIANTGILGPCFDWSENGRDILHFLINYLDSPTFLLPNPNPSIARSLLHKANPLEDPQILSLDLYIPKPDSKRRKVIGIGHSLGGGSLAFAASSIPSLFDSVIFVDPVIKPPTGSYSGPKTLAEGALRRKDFWPSREVAKEMFLTKKFFQVWDSRVLDLYLEFGLKEVENGVTLTMNKEDESIVFSDPAMISSRRAFDRISNPTSAQRCLPIHYIFADENRSILTEPQIKMTRELVKGTSNRIKGSGHLIALELPKELAIEIVNYLKLKVKL